MRSFGWLGGYYLQVFFWSSLVTKCINYEEIEKGQEFSIGVGGFELGNQMSHVFQINLCKAFLLI